MIRVGIAGYGNLGKGTEAAVFNAPDMELKAVFTRREPGTLQIKTPGVPVISFAQIIEYKDEIDVIINCGGSAADLPITTPMLAEYFNVVDSFDRHAKIPEHFAKTDECAKRGQRLAIIAAGWDPGLFSVARLTMQAVLPGGAEHTFWGRGISQGHSDAIRRIEGVEDARQYTVPNAEALQKARSGELIAAATREKHRRECYVAAKEGADKDKIAEQIKTMPDYFADYNTDVTFVSAEQLRKEHSGLPHGGSVIHTGFTGFGGSTKHTMEYTLRLASNPEFTGSVLTAYAGAAFRLAQSGKTGCCTPFDIAPALLAGQTAEALRLKFL